MRTNISNPPDKPQSHRHIAFSYGWEDALQLKRELHDPIGESPVLVSEMIMALDRFIDEGLNHGMTSR